MGEVREALTGTSPFVGFVPVKTAAKKEAVKAPRSHIVRQESEEAFLKEVADFMERGFRPIQDMKIFAS